MKTKYKYDIHHRLPRQQGGTNYFPSNNLKRVVKKRHAHWHSLFGGCRSLESIVKELNTVWIDPRYELVIQFKKEVW